VTTPTDIHSCSYFCTRPACVLAQRDEMRAELARLREQDPVDMSMILGAVARGWCHKGNASKELDVVLAKAIADEIAELFAAAPPAQPAPAQRLPLVQATAPREIWLQVSDEDDHAEPFPADHEGITWCQDSVLSCEVKYVRADLAQPAAQPVQPQGWVLVPMELTPAMWDAACPADEMVDHFDMPSAYLAMIAARPGGAS
jgi:hypothetical protein